MDFLLHIGNTFANMFNLNTLFMKKSLFICVTAFFSCAVILLSCKKNESSSLTSLLKNDEDCNLHQNEATWIYSGDSKRPKIFWRVFVGHSLSDCGGKCIKLLGEWGHVDCVGYGETCKKSAYASIEPGAEGDDFTLILEDADVLGIFLEYPFPDRALKITNPQNNTDLWLNIPEQYLHRESEKDFFILYNAWFSETAELENR